MNDNSRKAGARDEEEHSGEGVDGEENEDGCDYTSEWRTHPCFRLDGRSRKGACGWVCTQEGAENICEPNCY